MKCKRDNCKAPALKDDPAGFCFWHSDLTADKRRQAQTKGGHKGKIPLEPVIIQNIEDLRLILEESINDLRLSGGDAISKARAIGYVVGVMLEIFEKSNIEQRLTELEQQLTENTNFSLTR